MAQASRDENSVPTLLGASTTDGVTPVRIYADPVTHRLLVDASSGSFNLTVEESGGGTSVSNVDTIVFDGATVTDDGGGQVTVTITGGTGTVDSVVGTAGRITVDSTDPANPIVNIDTNYVGQNTITTLGTIVTGVWQGTSISTTYTDAKVVDVTGTADRITIGGTASSPTVDIAATYVGQNTITTLGTITTGVWTGTDIALADGGTGASLVDPGADRILFWDDSAGAVTWLEVGSGLTITDTTISATGGSGITIGTTTITSGTNTRILYNNAGVVGEYTLTGSGTVVAMQTAPTFVTSITTPSVLATANDSGALGASGTAFSDLFLAEGGVINWDSGDVTLTQSGNTLTLAGGDLVLAENTSVQLDPSLSADGTYSGITITGTAGTTLAFGDWVYLAASDSRWELTDADAASTAGSVLVGVCVQAAAGDGSATTILLSGNIRADAAFPAFTVSAPIYLSTTPGDVTNTAPSATDDVVRVVGFGLTADSMVVNVSPDYITIV